MNLFTDRIYRLPRIWSNRELEKFSHLFKGDIVNVSGWKDMDKEGRRYRDYFVNADTYTITNYGSDGRGYQGLKGEIFLDLEKDLHRDLFRKFDVVFNHTTLEHVYSVHKAFANLCSLSKDIVILVLPFLQEHHSNYGFGDYWRFSPLVIERLFQDNQYVVLYQSFNHHIMSSVYVFSIAARNPEKWENRFDKSSSRTNSNNSGLKSNIGSYAVPNLLYKFFSPLHRRLSSVKKR